MIINTFINFKKKLWDIANILFPIHRSLNSPGNLKTLLFFKKINPKIKIVNYKSGKKIEDWQIPYQWTVNNAFIIEYKKNGGGGINKKKILDLKKNNLHIVQFSKSIDKKIDYLSLKKKIFFIAKKPNAIPYVYSFYKKDWGFCMTYKQFQKLNKKNIYHVKIDSAFNKGVMPTAEAKFKGRSEKEILFSTYICHPSMANNEVSGMVVTNAILKYISEKRNLFYTYKFLLAPETIGAIAYINKYKKSLVKNLIAGFNISCVGDDKAFSLLTSKDNNSLADLALKAAIFKKKKFKQFSFLDRGSNERQFCSPLLNLPFCNFSRSLYDKYEEYHSSLDNMNFIKQEALEESLDLLVTIIDAFEIGIYPKSNFIFEPFYSKYNLYPMNCFGSTKKEKNKKLRDFVAYCDGTKNIFEICQIIDLDLTEVLKILRVCKNLKIVSTYHSLLK
jgi:aminopeptidase-like protein